MHASSIVDAPTKGSTGAKVVDTHDHSFTAGTSRRRHGGRDVLVGWDRSCSVRWWDALRDWTGATMLGSDSGFDRATDLDAGVYELLSVGHGGCGLAIFFEILLREGREERGEWTKAVGGPQKFGASRRKAVLCCTE